MKEDKNDSKAPKIAKGPAPAGGGAAAFRLTGFPKEFERNIWEDMDKRYMLIMLCSWIFVYGIAAILGSIDYDQAALAERARQNYLEKFYQDACLMEQPFVKDEDKTVRDLINDAVFKLGENIIVRRFARYKVGEDL